MSTVIINPFLLGATYTIPFSGDFNGTDGYLAFTPASAGNRQVWTFSTWANRDGTGRDSMFGAGGSDTVFHYIQFTAGNKLDVHEEGGPTIAKVSTATYTDTTNWHHWVVQRNSTTVRVWLDGTEITAGDTNTNPTAGDGAVNNAVQQVIGGQSNVAVSTFFDGLMADVIMIDGTALDYTSFAEDVGGTWTPKNPAGLTFGDQGWWISDPSTGVDSSGNGNNFTKSGTIAQSASTPTSP